MICTHSCGTTLLYSVLLGPGKEVCHIQVASAL